MIAQFGKEGRDDPDLQTQRAELIRHQLLDGAFVIGQTGGLHQGLQEGGQLRAGGLDSLVDGGEKGVC